MLPASMEKSFRRLESKVSSRHAFVEADTATAIAHQIRLLRQQRGWSQFELARRLETTQANVSRMEDPSYGRLTFKTLSSLAKVFDTGLQIKFISLVRQFASTRVIHKEDLEVEPFEIEARRVAFKVAADDVVVISGSPQFLPSVRVIGADSNLSGTPGVSFLKNVDSPTLKRFVFFKNFVVGQER